MKYTKRQHLKNGHVMMGISLTQAVEKNNAAQFFSLIQDLKVRCEAELLCSRYRDAMITLVMDTKSDEL